MFKNENPIVLTIEEIDILEEKYKKENKKLKDYYNITKSEIDSI